MPSAEYTVYKAWRDALVNDATLTALTPALNIFIGPRKADAPVPSIAITTVGEAPIKKTQGAKISGELFEANPTFQLEIAVDDNMAKIVEVSDAIFNLIYKDNATLNTAGISNIKQVGKLEYRDERNLLCRALRYSFVYRFKLT